jgi:NACHT domain
MSRPPGQRTMQSRLIRLCQRLRPVLVSFWSIMGGIIVSIVVVLLTTKGTSLTETPLAWIFVQHFPIALACGGVLLLLWVVVLVFGRPEQDVSSTSSSQPSLESEPYRSEVIGRCRQLVQSLQGTAMLAVVVQKRTDLMLSSDSRDPWSMDTPGKHSLAARTSIVQAYDEAGPGLLILGVPGAGKSTLLRQLASELLSRAEQHDKQRVPVILNLSSWANKKPLLTTWLVDQLQLVYAIPRRLGRAWIAQDQLLLLLDGLDEVDAVARPDVSHP